MQKFSTIFLSDYVWEGEGAPAGDLSQRLMLDSKNVLWFWWHMDFIFQDYLF